MPALMAYRIRRIVDGHPVTDFDDVIDPREFNVTPYGPITGNGYIAKAYVINDQPPNIPWVQFLQGGFPDLQARMGRSPSSLVVVKVPQAMPGRKHVPDLMFAFAFGPAGRHLLRGNSYERGYGLRTALNLIYPKLSSDLPRLREIDSKRRGSTIVRARTQTSQQTDIETFNINELRDVMDRATGAPADVIWGSRVSGGDSLGLAFDQDFDQIGALCRRIETAHGGTDYRARFAWIDNVQPVTDPDLIDRLTDEVLNRLRTRQIDGLHLAPPEIVDWDRVIAFKYHFDRRPRGQDGPVTHSDIRLPDYIAGLDKTGKLQDVDVKKLRTGQISALDADDALSAKWSAWRCLTGDLQLGRETFILDDGDFFRVDADYMKALDQAVGGIPISTLSLPATTRTTIEETYNRTAARSSPNLLLLDRQTVRLPGRSPIEICDLLSADRCLVHVKRHRGSSDLSHLFNQGLVSAELLQMNEEFRAAAIAKINQIAGARAQFNFLRSVPFVPSDYEVVYAIVEAWKGRSMVEALPFFSKVALREVATNLRSRGFRVAMQQIEAA
jgi:uncharacterized protein (TIGR04141 family)